MAAALRSMAAPAAVGDRGDARLTQAGRGRWRLDGDLTLAAVAALAAQTITADAAGQATLDLGGVGRASSAGVALLLEWKAALRSADAELVLQNAPAALRRLAELAHVDELLWLVPVRTPTTAGGELPR
jgi:phospholipid transport system transporter-binding protein